MSGDTEKLVTSSTSADDADLVTASKAGDLAAFEELVARYDCKLLRIAQNITHNFDDAQEVVQDTFLKVFQKLDSFRGDSKFSTWIFRITVNHSLMKLRKQRTKQRAAMEFSIQDEEQDKLPMDLSDWRPNPEELYKTSELRDLLASALRELRPGLRVVFVLHDIEGHSLQETAEALRLTLTAVKTRSMRARFQLRERLSPHFRNEVRWKAHDKADNEYQTVRPNPAISNTPLPDRVDDCATPHAFTQAVS